MHRKILGQNNHLADIDVFFLQQHTDQTFNIHVSTQNICKTDQPLTSVNDVSSDQISADTNILSIHRCISDIMEVHQF